MSSHADHFPVVSVPEDRPRREETLGSKAKFWYLDDGGVWTLYKQRRRNTGEHWAEKIAAELAELLGLPHAHYELAVYADTYGTASRNFVPDDAALIHGNELLLARDPDYPTEQKYHVKRHTLSNVLAALADINPRLPIDAQDTDLLHTWRSCFTGYLLLDAWIGNGDRHHENWAVVRRGEVVHLAPTYDHAASLGRELTDDKRKARLQTRDRTYDLEAYGGRCKSAFYHENQEQPMSPIEAFRTCAMLDGCGRQWLGRLRLITNDDCSQMIERIPNEMMSGPARAFTLALLAINRMRLFDLEGEFS